jgi:Zn ribbon nucleic-acid-binding protein
MGWYAGEVECRMCRKRHAAVWPEDTDEDENMECLNCGHMTCEPVTLILPDGRVVDA